MGEITTYFGKETISIIISKAQDNLQEFFKQSKATKAAVANDLKIENEILKIRAHEMLDALKTSKAQNEY